MGNIKNKINQWKTRGAIAPSSKFLVNKMLNKLDYRQDLDLLQFGYGKGVFTKSIIKKITPNSTLTIFEIDQNCQKYKIADRRITYIENSAEKVSEYCKKKTFSHIISTLPFASLPRKVAENIFVEIKKHLKKNGKFLQFQYSLLSKKDIYNLFNNEPSIDFELLNLPPAFIYETKNNSLSIRINLTKMLQKRNIKLAEIANKSGISITKLSILKKGKAHAICFSTIAILCKILNCKPNDLLEYIKC